MKLVSKARKFCRLVVKKQSKMPEVVSLSITTMCNMNCEMCYRYWWDDFEFKHMDFDMCRHVIDRLQSIDRLSLTGLGESLVHPRFLDIVSLVNDKLPEIDVCFTTNGTLFDEGMQKGIVERKVKEIVFSLEDFDCSYPGSGVHQYSEKAQHNIESFVMLNSEKDRRINVIIKSVMISKDQIAEVFRFAGFTGVDSVTITRMDVPLDSEARRLSEEEERDIIRYAKILSKRYDVESFCPNNHDLPMRIASHFDNVCLVTDNSIFVDVDANVSPCCTLRDYRIGSLLDQKLEEIWRSDLSASFLSKQPEVCGVCDIFKHRRWH